MTTAKTASHSAKKKSSAKKASTKISSSSAKKSSAKKSPAKKKSSAESSNHCWPGFKPVPGKAHNEKGSCEPKEGKQKKSTRRADQKAAAASKLQKTNPR